MILQTPFSFVIIFGLLASVHRNKVVGANDNYNATHKIITRHNDTHTFISIEPIDGKSSLESDSELTLQGSFDVRPRNANATELSADEETDESFSTGSIILIITSICVILLLIVLITVTIIKYQATKGRGKYNVKKNGDNKRSTHKTGCSIPLEATSNQ